MEDLPGNAGAVFLIDRDGGTALKLTLWDSDAAARATDQFAEQSRAATVMASWRAAARSEGKGRGASRASVRIRLPAMTAGLTKGDSGQ